MGIKVIVWGSAFLSFFVRGFNGHLFITFRSLKVNALFAHDMYHSSLLVRRRPISDQLWLGHVGFSFCGRIHFGRIRKEAQKDDKKALI
jgi:hypothetical protein